ncbi:hypothetical protein BDV23DRAFT_147994 [Aspergillus alliaceus]|uniref:Uncharacterized protein n=1 Tax=Petromyces alliaceus TaxID=209559 RepID=A0A5N7CJX0_PETAA|nr:hypothetical protein BDV23DRAFT_147994 [Aspergillus alliaceus]
MELRDCSWNNLFATAASNKYTECSVLLQQNTCWILSIYTTSMSSPRRTGMQREYHFLMVLVILLILRPDMPWIRAYGSDCFVPRMSD